MGDPAGVGPEILVKAHASGELHAWCDPVVYGDAAVLRRAADVVGKAAEIVEHGEPALGRIVLVQGPVLRLDDVPFGQVSDIGSRAMAATIRAAARDVLGGTAAAIVTCPITKEGLRLAGEPYPGHTEMLAALCGGADVVMMLWGERLRVALCTIHVALRRALDLLTPALVERTIRITDRFFRSHMGVATPRIGVAGVNPHASEGGLFGDEEATIVSPAIAACRAAGIEVTGPYPPDTVFHRAFHGAFDVVVAMTHDHGLIPLKLVHFEDGVNVTMGLPIIRTSVDHGTAYDIAGTGKASPLSLLAAARMAARMSERMTRNAGAPKAPEAGVGAGAPTPSQPVATKRGANQ